MRKVKESKRQASIARQQPRLHHHPSWSWSCLVRHQHLCLAFDIL